VRPVTVSITGNGLTQNSAPVPLDYMPDPFNVGLFFVTSGSTTAFTVQYSGDDPWATYATDYNTNGIWFNHPFLAALTSNLSGNIAFAVRAVRLQANNAGVDTGTLKIVQSSGP
jgi:hypothetical protein